MKRHKKIKKENAPDIISKSAKKMTKSYEINKSQALRKLKNQEKEKASIEIAKSLLKSA